MGLFMLAYLLVFSVITLLYYFKAYNTISNENIAKHQIKVSECKRLSRFVQQDCSSIKVVNEFNLKEVYIDISIGFGSSFVIFLILSYLLARHALKPVHDSITLMDNFINTIIHDINTPLSVIKINASGLKKKVEDPKLRNRTDRILDAIESIESLEDQLLFSIRTHSMQLEDINFDLNGLILEKLDEFNSIDPNIGVVYDGEACMIVADKDALYRLLLNLVSNAIKFSPAGSKVEIHLKNRVLRVIDHGLGIKEVDKVFEQYYREQSAQKGLGLGLFIVHEIAARYAIDIKVTSSSAGTTFELKLHA